MPEKSSTVTVTWNEPLSHYGIKPEMVEEAVKRGVREHLLEDAEFRGIVREAIASTAKTMPAEALVQAVKKAVVGALGDKITAQKTELLQCLRDFQNFKTAHASEYADRRFKELLKRIDELDAM